MDDQVTDKGTPLDYGGYAGLDRSDGRLQRLARHVRRDALLMAAIVLAALFISFLVLQLSPKLYLARSTVVLDSIDMRVDPTTGEIATANILPIQIETEIDIMRSQEFASRVADDLDLVSDPFLNPEYSRAGTEVAEEELERQRDMVVTRLLAQYRLSRRGESLAIDIFTLHPDAERAAQISNAVSEITITKSAEDRRSRLQSTIEFLDARVLDMEADLAKAEEELAAFIRDNELDRTTYSEELLLRIERARSVLAIERERDPAGAEVASLEAELAALEETLRQRTRHELQRLNLTRTLETEQSRYQAFVDRRNSLETQLDVIGSPFRQITRAQPPTSPYSPNPTFILGSGLAIGVLFALAATAVRFRFDRRLTTVEAVERQTGLPNLGFIPRLDLPDLDRPGALVRHLNEVVRSPYSEAIRTLLTGLINRTEASGCPVIAVTSALESEGKSTLTLSLAAIASQEVKRVLVLDLDLQRQGLMRLAGVEGTGKCSVDLLRDADALMPEIEPDRVSPGVDLLAFRRGEIVPRSILSDPAYLRTFARLRHDYSVIFIDTPPLLQVDEAARLAGLADSTLLVVAYDRSTADGVRSAALLLEANMIHVAGTALTGVDPSHFRGQGYYAAG